MADQPPPTLAGLGQNFTHHGHDYRMVKPFGPSVLETRLPDDVLQKMLTLTDQLLADQQRVSYGPNLVGQILEEPEIPLQTLREHGVFEYIHSIFAEYVLGCSYCDADAQYKQSVEEFQASPQYNNPVFVNVEAAWLVSQQQGEFNPIHNHSLSTLSSVMYLKVPEEMTDTSIPGKAPVHGNIEWVDGSTGAMQNATLRVKPQVGMFYVFPAYLLHLVYPFAAASERRSVSINASHKL